MIAVYVRVSTDKQTTAAQQHDLNSWAVGKDGVQWFSDKATGKTMDRPGFNRLLDAIRAGKVKRLVVWRLDRLGRTAKGLTALFDELIERGVDFTSMRDGIDLRTPAGRLIANVLASVAAYETEVRGERIAAGIAAKHKRGEKWNNGRPKGSADVATPEVCEQVRLMTQAGKGPSEIARILKVGRSTVYRILRSS